MANLGVSVDGVLAKPVLLATQRAGTSSIPCWRLAMPSTTRLENAPAHLQILTPGSEKTHALARAPSSVPTSPLGKCV